MKKLLVTSALPYANGSIHLGHLVEYIQTDIWVRYWRLRGRDVIYLCADDTHGTPIMLRARAEGIAPEELIQRMHREHLADFQAFHIHFDNYYTTHSEENRQLAATIFRELQRNGHIAERSIEQAYCNQDQMFLPDRYIRGTCPHCGSEDQYGDACEKCMRTYSPRDLIDSYCVQCGTTPVMRESTHLFFQLSNFSDRLQDWLKGGRVQEEVANKLQEWFQAGLQDWDITRDAPYFGFEIPDHPGKYFYVWLDAPVGYMASTLNWCQQDQDIFDSYWHSEDSEVFHFIGKDIVYFHALFWPAMLMGSGFRTPTQLCVHGFLTVNGEKMSKQRGTFINAATYLADLDPEYLRYYYATKLTARVEDLDLNLEDFRQRINADLVNKIANVPSRVLAILHKSCGGRLSTMDDPGRALWTRLRGQVDEVATLYESREFNKAVLLLNEMTGEINVYLQDHKPWQLAKEEKKEQAGIVCTSALNAFRIVATLLQPIMPEMMGKFATMLRVSALTWEGLDEVLEDCEVGTYERLAERVEPKKLEAVVEASRQSLGQQEEVEAPTLTLDGLVDCELLTWRIESARAVPNARQLNVLHLRRGEETRQVVAGLPEEVVQPLVQQDVLVLSNLAPRTFQGETSQGMLLASGEENPVPVVPPPEQTAQRVE